MWDLWLGIVIVGRLCWLEMEEGRRAGTDERLSGDWKGWIGRWKVVLGDVEIS